MRTPIQQNRAQRTGLLLVGAALAAFVLPFMAQGQNPDQKENSHSAHAPEQPATSAGSLADQIRTLKSKVAALEATLAQRQQATATHTPQQGGQAMKPMSGMPRGSMQGMGMMGSGMKGGPMGMMSGMDGNSSQGMSGMGMGMMERDGMSMMGRMQGMGQMQMPSALPGFPGASHIYHIGATGFFLDHPEHLTLSPDQQAALNRIKEKALLDQSTAERKIDEAEQELWMLTASDQPDSKKIETKVREIEELQGDQRLAFIRSVGEAAKLLSDEQRKALLGAAGEKPGAQNGN